MMKIRCMKFNSLQAITTLLLAMSCMPLRAVVPGGDTLNTDYVEDLSDKLAVRIYGINKYNRFSLYDITGNTSVMYNPNESTNLGVGVNYKWFGLGVAFNLHFMNDDDDIYGKTDRFDFQVNVFTRKYVVDSYLQYYKGYYIQNPEDIYNKWTAGMPYPQRPDIFTSTLGVSFMWVFNHKKYSSRAAFIQTELQKKSAGSFIGGAYISLFNTQGDSSYVPSVLEDQFSDRLKITGATVSNLGISFGYAHTFVIWKKLYLSLALVPGISVQSYSINREGNEAPEENSNIALKSVGRFAIVRNARKSFFGLSVNGDNVSLSRKKDDLQDQITYSVGAVRIFYGRRFSVSSEQ